MSLPNDKAEEALAKSQEQRGSDAGKRGDAAPRAIERIDRSDVLGEEKHAGATPLGPNQRASYAADNAGGDSGSDDEIDTKGKSAINEQLTVEQLELDDNFQPLPSTRTPFTDSGVARLNTYKSNPRLTLMRMIDELIRTEESAYRSLVDFVQEKAPNPEYYTNHGNVGIINRILNKLSNQSPTEEPLVIGLNAHAGGWVNVLYYLNAHTEEAIAKTTYDVPAHLGFTDEELAPLNNLITHYRELCDILKTSNPFLCLINNPNEFNKQFVKDVNILDGEFLANLKSSSTDYFNQTITTLYAILTSDEESRTRYFVCIEKICLAFTNQKLIELLGEIFVRCQRKDYHRLMLRLPHFEHFQYQEFHYYLVTNLLRPIERIVKYYNLFNLIQLQLNNNNSIKMNVIGICERFNPALKKLNELGAKKEELGQQLSTFIQLNHLRKKWNIDQYLHLRTTSASSEIQQLHLRRSPELLSLMAMVLRVIDCYNQTDLWEISPQPFFNSTTEQYNGTTITAETKEETLLAGDTEGCDKLAYLKQFMDIAEQGVGEGQYANDLAEKVLTYYMRTELSDEEVRTNLIKYIVMIIKKINSPASILANTFSDILDELKHEKTSVLKSSTEEEATRRVIDKRVYDRMVANPACTAASRREDRDTFSSRAISNDHYIRQHMIAHVKSFFTLFNNSHEGTYRAPSNEYCYIVNKEIQKDLKALLHLNAQELKARCGDGSVRDLIIAILARHLTKAGVFDLSVLNGSFIKTLSDVVNYLNNLVQPGMRAEIRDVFFIADPIPYNLNSTNDIDDELSLYANILLVLNIYIGTPLGKKVAAQYGVSIKENLSHIDLAKEMMEELEKQLDSVLADQDVNIKNMSEEYTAICLANERGELDPKNPDDAIKLRKLAKYRRYMNYLDYLDNQIINDIRYKIFKRDADDLLANELMLLSNAYRGEQIYDVYSNYFDKSTKASVFSERIDRINAERIIFRHLIQRIYLQFDADSSLNEMTAAEKIKAFFDNLYQATPNDLRNLINRSKLTNNSFFAYVKAAIEHILSPDLPWLSQQYPDFANEINKLMNFLQRNILKQDDVGDFVPEIILPHTITVSKLLPESFHSASIVVAAKVDEKTVRALNPEEAEEDEENAVKASQEDRADPKLPVLLAAQKENITDPEYWYHTENVNQLFEKLLTAQEANVIAAQYPLHNDESRQLFEETFGTVLKPELLKRDSPNATVKHFNPNLPTIIPVNLTPKNVRLDDKGRPVDDKGALLSMRGSHWIGLVITRKGNDVDILLLNSLGNFFSNDVILTNEHLALGAVAAMVQDTNPAIENWNRISSIIGMLVNMVEVVNKFKLKLVLKKIQQQNNSSDCGPFMVQSCANLILRPEEGNGDEVLNLEPNVLRQYHQSLINDYQRERAEREAAREEENRRKTQNDLSSAPPQLPDRRDGEQALGHSGASASSTSSKAPPQLVPAAALSSSAVGLTSANGSLPLPARISPAPAPVSVPHARTTPSVSASSRSDAARPDNAGVTGDANALSANPDGELATGISSNGAQEASERARQAGTPSRDFTFPDLNKSSLQLIANVLVIVNYYCNTFLGKQIVKKVNDNISDENFELELNRKRGQKKKALLLADSLVKVYLNQRDIKNDDVKNIIGKIIEQICGNDIAFANSLIHSPHSRLGNSLKVLLNPELIKTIDKDHLLPLLHIQDNACLDQIFYSGVPEAKNDAAEDAIHQYFLLRARDKFSGIEHKSSTIGRIFKKNNKPSKHEKVGNDVQRALTDLSNLSLTERKEQIAMLKKDYKKSLDRSIAISKNEKSASPKTILDLVKHTINQATVRVGMIGQDLMRGDFGEAISGVSLLFNKLSEKEIRAKSIKDMIVPSQFCRYCTFNSRPGNTPADKKLALLANMVIISNYYCNTPLGQRIADEMHLPYNTENIKWAAQARRLSLIASCFYLNKLERGTAPEFDNNVIYSVCLELKRIVEEIRNSRFGSNSRLANELARLCNHFGSDYQINLPVLDGDKYSFPQVPADKKLVIQATFSYGHIGDPNIIADDAEDIIQNDMIQKSVIPFKQYKHVTENRMVSTNPDKIDALNTIEENLDILFRMKLDERKAYIQDLNNKKAVNESPKDISHLIKACMKGEIPGTNEPIHSLESPANGYAPSILRSGKFGEAVNRVFKYLFTTINPKNLTVKAPEPKPAPEAVNQPPVSAAM